MNIVHRTIIPMIILNILLQIDSVLLNNFLIKYLSIKNAEITARLNITIYPNIKI